MKTNVKKGVLEFKEYNGPRHKVVVIDGVEQNLFFLSSVEIFSSLSKIAETFELEEDLFFEKYNDTDMSIAKCIMSLKETTVVEEVPADIERCLVDSVEETDLADSFFKPEPKELNSAASYNTDPNHEVDPIRSARLKGIPHRGIVCRYGGVEYKSQSALERAYDLRKGVIANLRRNNPEIANNMRAIMRKALKNKELKRRRSEIKVEKEPAVEKVSIHGPIKAKPIEAYGITYPSQKEMSRILGMEKNYVASAIRRGLTPEEIVDNARRIQEKRARNK